MDLGLTISFSNGKVTDDLGKSRTVNLLGQKPGWSQFKRMGENKLKIR